MRILILGGTSDANKIGSRLKLFNGLEVIITTNSKHGKELAKNHCHKVVCREESSETLEEIIVSNNIDIIIDATHPFATNISKKGMELSEKLNIPYIRYERPTRTYKGCIYVDNFKDACLTALKLTDKNIMYCGGIKNLENVVDIVGRDRVICRVLPISVVRALKYLPSKNIIGMEGVFSKDLNKYLLMEYNCGVLITKDSGDSGGLEGKIFGALECGAVPIVVKRPKLNYNVVFDNIEDIVNYILDLRKNK